MTDNVQFSSSGDGRFEMERIVNGRRHVYRTDSEGEYIRYNVEGLFEEFGVAGSVKVEGLGDRWFRVEVTYPPDLDSERRIDLGTTIHAAFGTAGKGWYECREEGGNRDGSAEWFVVRHDHGPWL